MNDQPLSGGFPVGDPLSGGHRRTLPHLVHLAGRFFDTVRSRPLTPREESEVAALLRPGEADLFWDQMVMDQRHGLDTARRVLSSHPGRRDLARAALLHDIGKRHVRLGVFGRVWAATLAMLGRPAKGRRAVYLDHAGVGADDLARAGAEPLVVDFARHHTGPRPASIDPETWRILRLADEETESLGTRGTGQYDEARPEGGA